MEKEEEKKYYEQVFKRINSSKWRDSIILMVLGTTWIRGFKNRLYFIN